MTDTRPGDLALVATGAVLWGTGGVTGALLEQEGVAPLAVATYRLGVGGGLLVLVLLALGRWRRVPRTRRVLARVAVTGVLAALYQGCYFLAVSRGSVAVATLVALGAAPVIVAGLTSLLTRRAPSARTLLAIGLALVGLVLLLGAPVAGSASGAALAAPQERGERERPGL
ncbi:MAG TPA: EamA family transporter, partial [Actinotalea sp.]|nr:EamA family transporter [Actinotalea sp.]